MNKQKSKKWNVFKRTSCNHDFVYMKKERLDKFPGPNEVAYTFICKKCRKKKIIYSTDIKRLIDKYNDELCKKKALENYIDVSKSRFFYGSGMGSGFGVFCCDDGYVADKVIKHYDHLGINIMCIEDINKDTRR